MKKKRRAQVIDTAPKQWSRETIFSAQSISWFESTLGAKIYLTQEPYASNCFIATVPSHHNVINIIIMSGVV